MINKSLLILLEAEFLVDNNSPFILFPAHLYAYIFLIPSFITD